MGLHRRSNQSELSDVMSAVETELQGSGNRLGYRLMHQLLLRRYGLTVDRETVRKTLTFLDFKGVEIQTETIRFLRS